MGRVQARVSRLLEMVVLLQSDEGWRSAALAERFGISRTQVYNDVRALREAKVPVRRSVTGYRIDPSFFLPSVSLTPQEVFSLLLPSQLLVRGARQKQVRRGAEHKLLSCLPETLRRGAAALLRRTSVVIPASDIDDEVMGQLRTAVAERDRIVIVYSSRTKALPRRLQIDPYGIAFRKHAWYVVAYSAEHREVRKFRVSRITAAEPTPLHFTVPRDFSLESCFAGAWYVFGGEPREILLRFSPRVARFVRERRPHPQQQIQTLSDGTILYRAVVNSLDEVAWWIVQYGGDAVVTRPPELRDKVIALASSILERYGAAFPPGERARRPFAAEAPASLGMVGEGEPPSYGRKPPPPEAEA